MKNVSASISDQLYDGLQEFCNRNNSNINQVLGKAVQGLLQGKVKMKPIGGFDICPQCGHAVHLYQRGNEIFFVCLNCDWAKRLGYYRFPA